MTPSHPYGPPISLAHAKKVAEPAVIEAQKENLSIAVAIVDSAGGLVYYEKMDNTMFGSANVAIDKARSAAAFKRPTKVFQDAVAGGNTSILKLPGVVATEGGVPLLVDGKIVGAIGVSGGTSAQDAIVAQAGVDALPKILAQ